MCKSDNHALIMVKLTSGITFNGDIVWIANFPKITATDCDTKNKAPHVNTFITDNLISLFKSEFFC